MNRLIDTDNQKDMKMLSLTDRWLDRYRYTCLSKYMCGLCREKIFIVMRLAAYLRDARYVCLHNVKLYKL